MPIRFNKKQAMLDGFVTVEDAEALSNWLRDGSGRAVHLGQCAQVHGAVLQVLMALKPRLAAAPADAHLAATLHGAGLAGA
ncbi:hypothetical protein [Aquabacterium sp. OR-4]|uniref:hypothetical protein n=1 Tax=Aquabacterium sp. OR-4 TaxID=2978127 RepID=UPI0021B18665|nr:hypothetical protein [Aquabacterium sp. OR-4]MDT7835970.1 hypothetical protein [Aquabacterium sp. OR-4]